MAFLVVVKTVSHCGRFGLIILLLLHAKTRIDRRFCLANNLLLSLLLVFGALADQVLGLSVHVLARLGLVTSVAAQTPLEVVVLALTADPASVREVKVLLRAALISLLWSHYAVV